MLLFSENTSLCCCASLWHFVVSEKNLKHIKHWFDLTTLFASSNFSSVAQSRPTLWDPMVCSMPSLPVHHQLLEFTQTRVHWVDDAIQPSHHLLSPFPPAFNLSQHQGLFTWVSSSNQVAKVLEFHLQK